jgi:hypothetical protein
MAEQEWSTKSSKNRFMMVSGLREGIGKGEHEISQSDEVVERWAALGLAETKGWTSRVA